MKAIMNFLEYINENWTMIVAIVILLFAICVKAKKSFDRWISMTDAERQKETEEQIEKAKAAIAEYILSLVASAEIDWEGHGLGPIKRAQVIENIYLNYPILVEVVDQEKLLNFIDEHINLALEIVREKLRKDEDKKDEVKSDEV